jgi:acetylornithine/N-succinyldiaminopimelate aminotransferase
LWALRLPSAVAVEVAAVCLERGLLVNAPRDDVMRFMPALNVADEDIDRMLELLELKLRDVL